MMFCILFLFCGIAGPSRRTCGETVSYDRWRPMPKHIHKSRVVLSALGRLGFHAHPSDVVAELAKFGIEVSAGLVQKVKIETAKDTSGVRRQKARAGANPKPRVVRKTPARRSQGK